MLICVIFSGTVGFLICFTAMVCYLEIQIPSPLSQKIKSAFYLKCFGGVCVYISITHTNAHGKQLLITKYLPRHKQRRAR